MKILKKLSSILIFLLAGSLSFAPVLALAQTTNTPQAEQLINSKGTVYYVTPNGLLGFTSPTIFYSWGYNFSQVVLASSAETALPMIGLVPIMQSGCSTPLDQINGTCSSSAGGIQTGSLIDKGGTIYLIGTTGVYGFPDLKTFDSWGYNFSQVVLASSAETALPMIGLVPIMQSGCSTPLDQINGTCSSVPVNIQSLNPTSGAVGRGIIITGSGFTATNNTINFGIGSFTGYASADGTNLTFDVPNSLSPHCASASPCPEYIQEVTPNNYNISITNSNGTSNSLAFTVTSPCPDNADCAVPMIPLTNPPVSTTTPAIINNCQNTSTSNGQCPATTPTITPVASPNISQISPASAPVGTSVTFTGSGFTGSGNTVNFSSVLYGSNLTVSNLTSSNGSTLTLTVPSHGNPPTCPNNAMCSPPPVFTGNYNVTVTNANGTSNTVSFSITTAGN